MDASFEKLEERVNAAVATIGRLRQERDLVRSRQGELEEQMAQLEKSNAELQKQLEMLRSKSVDKSEYETKKRQIESRVEGLLELFSELDEAEPAT